MNWFTNTLENYNQQCKDVNSDFKLNWNPIVQVLFKSNKNYKLNFYLKAYLLFANLNKQQIDKLIWFSIYNNWDWRI